MVAAQGGINKLRENVDTLLVIPNEKLLSISDKPLTLCDAFELADSVLKDTIRGISNIVYNCGNINIDYNDVKTTLENKGTGHFGIGTVEHDGSIIEAVNEYSCAMKSHFRKFGNQMSGSGNHLCNYASLLA